MKKTLFLFSLLALALAANAQTALYKNTPTGKTCVYTVWNIIP